MFPCGVHSCSLVTCHTAQWTFVFLMAVSILVTPAKQSKVSLPCVARHKRTRAGATREQPMEAGPYTLFTPVHTCEHTYFKFQDSLKWTNRVPFDWVCLVGHYLVYNLNSSISSIMDSKITQSIRSNIIPIKVIIDFKKYSRGKGGKPVVSDHM